MLKAIEDIDVNFDNFHILYEIAFEQIKEEAALCDFSAIYELLRFVPDKYLLGYLSEENIDKFKESIDYIE